MTWPSSPQPILGDGSFFEKSRCKWGKKFSRGKGGGGILDTQGFQLLDETFIHSGSFVFPGGVPALIAALKTNAILIIYGSCLSSSASGISVAPSVQGAGKADHPPPPSPQPQPSPRVGAEGQTEFYLPSSRFMKSELWLRKSPTPTPSSTPVSGYHNTVIGLSWLTRVEQPERVTKGLRQNLSKSQRSERARHTGATIPPVSSS